MSAPPTLLDRFLRTLAARGLTVRAGDKPGELRLVGPAAERTPDVMDALRKFKPDLLARFAPTPAPVTADDGPPEVEADPYAEEPAVGGQ